jgi:outer membrane protein assembly factor BamB
VLFSVQAWTPEGAEGQSQGGIMKVDATNGDSLWNFRTPRGGFYRMRPLVDDRVVYAGTRGGENTVFVALDAATGDVIWRNERVRVYAAEMAAGKIFVNTGRDLLALDKETGRTLWRAGLNAGHGESGLVYLDGYVYHPHGQAMRVVDAETGEIVHIEAPPDGSYFWEVGVGAGKVLAQSSRFLVAYQPYQPE